MFHKILVIFISIWKMENDFKSINKLLFVGSIIMLIDKLFDIKKECGR